MNHDHNRFKEPKLVMTAVYLRWRRICGEPLSQVRLGSRYTVRKDRTFFRRIHGV